MFSEDSALLELLGTALAPAPLEPPPEGIASLHRALAEQRSIAARAPVAAGRTSGRTWWRKRWVAAAATGAFVFGGSGVAFAAGAPLPTPVRALAHDIGLPVTSPGLYALHQDESQLSQILHQSEPNPSATAQAVRTLETQLNGFRAHEADHAGQERDRRHEPCSSRRGHLSGNPTGQSRFCAACRNEPGVRRRTVER
jgi:hypothetical protein